MSHYKPYPAYKDSCVEWIGDVPEHWRIVPMKAIANTVNGATPESGKPEYWDGDIPWYTPTDIDNEVANELGAPRRYITQAGFESCAVKLAPAGSVILSTRAPIGSVGTTRVPSTINQGCRTLIPVHNVPTEFLASLLVAARDELRLRGNGTTFQELSTEGLRSLRVPMPQPTECVLIANSLNRETTHIDGLIAKKTRFIELLKEKRTALITHAVTKGLNPNVKMKDSGVEWIGDVPEHWEVRSVKYLYNARLGKMVQPLPKSEEDVLVPYHRAQTVQWECIKYDQVESMWANPTEINTYSLNDGDLLICEGGDVCRAAMFNRVECETVIFQNSIHRVRPVGGNHPEWLLRLMQHVRSSGWIDVLCNKNTIVHFTSDKLASLECPNPPCSEQAEILSALDRETARIDALTEKTQRSINLLKERRSAFITAAVTGQIDLRETI